MEYYEEPSFQYRFVTYQQAILATQKIIAALRNWPCEATPLSWIIKHSGLPFWEARAVCIGLLREGYLRQIMQPNPALGLHFALPE